MLNDHSNPYIESTTVLSDIGVARVVIIREYGSTLYNRIATCMTNTLYTLYM